MLPVDLHQELKSARVPFELSGKRLDQVLSVLFPDYSRSRLQQWLLHGHVQVDGTVWRAKDKVKGGEQIALTAISERTNQPFGFRDAPRTHAGAARLPRWRDSGLAR